MGILQVMCEAMKSFAPTPANKPAAIAAAVKAGERFLTELQEPVDEQELRSAAIEVWFLYCRLIVSTLLPEAVRLQLPPLYSQENEPDPLVVCKFFTPDNSWTWYAYEFDGLDTVESRYVVPPFSVKVSGSRTGQDMSILKLAPYLLRKRQRQLIHR